MILEHKDILNKDKQVSKSYRKFDISNRAPSTKEKYTLQIDNFMKFAGLTKYDDLVKMDIDSRQDMIEDWIMNYSDKSKSLAALSFNSVKKFLDMNRCVYFSKAVTSLFPANIAKGSGEVPYTTEEIQRMLDVSHNARDRFVILFFTSTASRPGGTKDNDGYIQLKHIEEMPLGCKSVMIYADTKYEYYGFFMPETVRAFEAYLDFRVSRGEKITPESAMLVSARTKKDLGKPIMADTVDSIMRRIVMRAGIKRIKINDKYDKAIIYGFRKRFNGILKMDNQVNSNIAEKLMAHRNGLDGSYLKPTKEQCFNEFKKAIPALTVEEAEKLRIDNLKLRDKVQTHSKEDILKVFEMMDISVDDLKEFAEQKRKDRKYK